jgi:hypothetical protein
VLFAHDGNTKWYEVDEIASVVAATHQNLVTIISACDLTQDSYNPAAPSGAVSFLSAGIPAAVAMQSSILSSAGIMFIEALLDYFISPIENQSDHDNTIAHAAAWARGRMANQSKLRIQQEIDWSFPSLYVTEDGNEKLISLSKFIDGYKPAIIALQQLLPGLTTRPYFNRRNLEGNLRTLLTTNESGAQLICGPPQAGKSTAISFVCGQIFKEAYDHPGNPFRPILYVDLATHRGSFNDEIELVNLINKSIGDATPRNSHLSLFSEFQQKEMTSIAYARLINGILSQSNGIIILDNIDEEKWTYLSPLFTLCNEKKLRVMVVFVKTDTMKRDTAINVDYLSREECELFFSGDSEKAKNAYDAYGGNVFLLGQLRQGHKNPSGKAVVAALLKSVVKRYGVNAKPIISTLYVLSSLPNGVDSHLCKYLDDVTWDTLVELKDLSILVPKNTSAASPLVLPEFLSAALQNDTVNLNPILSNFTRGASHSFKKSMVEILSTDEGYYFVLDTFRTMIGMQGKDKVTVELLRAVPVSAHVVLFQRSRWSQAYELWLNFMSNTAEDSHLASDYLCYGKSAYQSSNIAKADLCIKKLEDLKLTKIEEIGLLDLKAMVLKQKGRSTSAEQLDQMYNRAIEIFDALPEETKSSVETLDKKAILLYNRSIFLRWWKHDLAASEKDMSIARDLFQQCGNRVMTAVSTSEMADMQIDVNANDAVLLSDLLLAKRYFESADQINDLGIALYRIGRLYKRRDAGDVSNSLSTASSYYYKAFTTFLKGNEAKQAAIAFKHFFVIEEYFLKKGSSTSRATMTTQLDVLRHYAKEDSWAARVLRDALWFQFKLTADKGTSLDFLIESFSTGITYPLLAIDGTDKGRACAILVDLLAEFQKRGAQIEIDNLFAEHTNWLATIGVVQADDLKSAEKIAAINKFSTKPNANYGKSTR